MIEIDKFFSKKLLSTNSGKTLRFRRYEPLDTQPCPLGDGFPGPTRFRAVDIDVNLSDISGVNEELLGRALSSSGQDSAFSRQQQRVQFPSGSPGFVDKLIDPSVV